SRPFVNVRHDNAWLLLVAFLVACLRDRGPYPIPLLTGEQGSGKSTRARFIPSLIDPNKPALRAEPRDERALAIPPGTGWVVGLHILFWMPNWLSDALCRLSTGGGFATRQLSTDDEEILFDAQRPAVLSSIEDVVSRADLLDRAVCLELEPISDEGRRTE